MSSPGGNHKHKCKYKTKNQIEIQTQLRYSKHQAAERWDLEFDSNTTEKFENSWGAKKYSLLLQICPLSVCSSSQKKVFFPNIFSFSFSDVLLLHKKILLPIFSFFSVYVFLLSAKYFFSSQNIFILFFLRCFPRHQTKIFLFPIFSCYSLSFFSPPQKMFFLLVFSSFSFFVFLPLREPNIFLRQIFSSLSSSVLLFLQETKIQNSRIMQNLPSFLGLFQIEYNTVAVTFYVNEWKGKIIRKKD